MARKASQSSRLKVFQAQFGFYDSVVAAGSQAAALRAWGTHQNLFADGQARLTSDEAAAKAALLQPGTPLRRPLGTTGAFVADPSDLPALPDLAPPGGRKRVARKPPPPKPEPDRTALTEAEGALAALEARRATEEAAFDQRRRALAAEVEDAAGVYRAARKAADATLAAARSAFRKQGGRS